MNESLGFLRHAALMLSHGFLKLKEDWEEGEVIMTPSKVGEMRKQVVELKRLLKDIEPFLQKFEGVASARRVEPEHV